MSPFRLTKACWPLSLPAIVLLMVSLPENKVCGASLSGYPHLQIEPSSSGVPSPLFRLIYLVFADSSMQEIFLVGLSLVLMVFSLLPLASVIFRRKSTVFKRFTDLLKGGLHLLAGGLLFTVVVFSGVNRWYVASAIDEILEDLCLVNWQPEGDSFAISGPVSQSLADLRGESPSFVSQSGSGSGAKEAVPLLQGATCGTIAPQGSEFKESSPPTANRNAHLDFGLGLEVR